MLSALFSQLPPRGVYNGKIPCANSHATNGGVLGPAKLSSTNSIRNAGNSAGNSKGVVNPCNHRVQACLDVAGVGGTAGNTSTRADHSGCNQPCKTSLVHERTP